MILCLNDMIILSTLMPDWEGVSVKYTPEITHWLKVVHRKQSWLIGQPLNGMIGFLADTKLTFSSRKVIRR